MTLGGGNYDEECMAARAATGAHTVALIVVGGRDGNGFAVQSTDLALMPHFPNLLRDIADMIERDLAGKANEGSGTGDS